MYIAIAVDIDTDIDSDIAMDIYIHRYSCIDIDLRQLRRLTRTGTGDGREGTSDADPCELRSITGPPKLGAQNNT